MSKCRSSSLRKSPWFCGALPGAVTRHAGISPVEASSPDSSASLTESDVVAPICALAAAWKPSRVLPLPGGALAPVHPLHRSTLELHYPMPQAEIPSGSAGLPASLVEPAKGNSSLWHRSGPSKVTPPQLAHPHLAASELRPGRRREKASHGPERHERTVDTRKRSVGRGNDHRGIPPNTID